MTNVTLMIERGSDKQKAFAFKAAESLQKIINAPEFSKEVQAASYSSREFLADDGNYQELTTFRSPLSDDVPADNILFSIPLCENCEVPRQDMLLQRAKY